MTPRRLITGVVLLAAGAAVAASATASGRPGAPPVVRPVIGQPVAVPAQPVAGKAFAVSFRVTCSDTGSPLAGGTMVCDPSVEGTVLRHAESFRAGTARLAFVVPASTAGKALRVKVTIAAGGRSATRLATFRIRPAASLPSLSIETGTVVEGNGGPTTLSFPVTLSRAAAGPVSVGYATADGTATAPADYASSAGTLTFRPGETARTIDVAVVGDTAYEPDETLTVTLADPVGATVLTGSAIGLIRNDDPLARPGHYRGQSSQNELFEFDVTADGAGVTGLHTGQVNQSCVPSWVTISQGRLDFGSYVAPVAGDGSFRIDTSYTGRMTTGESTATHVVITGRFTGDTAGGTLLKTIDFTLGGTAFSCSSGDQTWSATRTG